MSDILIKRKPGRPRKTPLKSPVKKVEKEEDENVNSSEGFEDNSFKKDEDSLGIFQHSKLVEGSGSYFNSEKIIIVGGSGAGKSTLSSNILIYICKKFSHIILVTGSCDDTSYLLIKKLCEENDIHFSIINSEGDSKGNIITPILKNCVLIFDDLQKSHGSENKAIKTLISNAFIRGRHDRLSTIWCCHSLKYIPDLVKNSCNMLFVDRKYEQIPLSMEIQTKNKWYMLNSFLNPSFCKPVIFKPLTIQNINRRLQAKIWKEDRNKKYADRKIKYGILQAGNDSSELKKEVENGMKSDKSSVDNIDDSNDQLQKMLMNRNFY